MMYLYFIAWRLGTKRPFLVLQLVGINHHPAPILLLFGCKFMRSVLRWVEHVALALTLHLVLMVNDCTRWEHLYYIISNSCLLKIRMPDFANDVFFQVRLMSPCF